MARNRSLYLLLNLCSSSLRSCMSATGSRMSRSCSIDPSRMPARTLEGIRESMLGIAPELGVAEMGAQQGEKLLRLTVAREQRLEAPSGFIPEKLAVFRSHRHLLDGGEK